MNTKPCCAVGEICSDLEARWIVLFSKGEEKDRTAFHLKFNDPSDMTLAVSRAKAAGYTAKTMKARP
jgi:hypothetical protein